MLLGSLRLHWNTISAADKETQLNRLFCKTSKKPFKYHIKQYKTFDPNSKMFGLPRPSPYMVLLIYTKCLSYHLV